MTGSKKTKTQTKEVGKGILIYGLYIYIYIYTHNNITLRYIVWFNIRLVGYIYPYIIYTAYIYMYILPLICLNMSQNMDKTPKNK